MTNIKPLSIAAVRALPSQEAVPDTHAWGLWVFHAATLTLRHQGEQYELDLEEYSSCAGMLDAIFQVVSTGWCSKEDTGHLLDALRDLLNPQMNLCSFGVEKEFDPTTYLTRRL